LAAASRFSPRYSVSGSCICVRITHQIYIYVNSASMHPLGVWRASTSRHTTAGDDEKLARRLPLLRRRGLTPFFAARKSGTGSGVLPRTPQPVPLFGNAGNARNPTPRKMAVSFENGDCAGEDVAHAGCPLGACSGELQFAVRPHSHRSL
jgi:hypothetical protein